jgi:hypothetical protein
MGLGDRRHPEPVAAECPLAGQPLSARAARAAADESELTSHGTHLGRRLDRLPAGGSCFMLARNRGAGRTFIMLSIEHCVDCRGGWDAATPRRARGGLGLRRAMVDEQDAAQAK